MLHMRSRRRIGTAARADPRARAARRTRARRGALIARSNRGAVPYARTVDRPGARGGATDPDTRAVRFAARSNRGTVRGSPGSAWRSVAPARAGSAACLLVRNRSHAERHSSRGLRQLAMGDYRTGFGGMEDYRRQEIMPLSTVNRGYEPTATTAGRARGGDKERADRIREEFLSGLKAASPRDAAIRRSALESALLTQEQVRGRQAEVCGFSPEARRQLFFTVLLVSSSIVGTISMSLERSFM